MTQEEKVKAYDKALEIAKKFYNDEQVRVGMTPIELEEIFPELKESEDERNWKLLLQMIHYNVPDSIFQHHKLNKDKFECWLEKQKSFFDINEVCKWLKDHAKYYVNGEYNHFHHCVDYDGTFNTDSLIKDLKDVFK